MAHGTIQAADGRWYNLAAPRLFMNVKLVHSSPYKEAMDQGLTASRKPARS
jgi:hypothetical protein